MTSAFSSNDAAVIDRNLDTVADGQTINQIWNEVRSSQCLEWISGNNFEKVNKKFNAMILRPLTQHLSGLPSIP